MEAGGRNKKTHRTAPKSDNVYLKLLVKVETNLLILRVEGLPCEPSLLRLRKRKSFAQSRLILEAEKSKASIFYRRLLPPVLV